MAHTLLREKARALRHKGKSIRDIAHLLSANKSTVSNWCRDIALTDKQIDRLAQNQRSAALPALLKASEARRRDRLLNVAKEALAGSKAVGKINKRDLFLLGLGLYWGEGYKSSNGELGFTNSDPGMIRAFIVWANRIYSIPKTALVLRVSINEDHAHRNAAVMKYWSYQTRIPITQFTSTSFIKAVSKKKYSNSTAHFGTLRVKIRKGTRLRRRILGSISEIKKQIPRTTR